MNDVVGVSLSLVSTVTTFTSHRWMERGARQEKKWLRVAGSCLNILAGILVSASLYFSDETVVAVLGSLIVPLTYAREKPSRKFIAVALVLLGAVFMIVHKTRSRTPNPYSDRMLWCVLLGALSSVALFNVEPRPMYAGWMASLTETTTKALMSTFHVAHAQWPMIGTYGLAMICFGVIQLLLLSNCYKHRAQTQVVPEFIVSIMIFDTLLAGWVFREWNPDVPPLFWIGMALSSVAALFLSL